MGKWGALVAPLQPGYACIVYSLLGRVSIPGSPSLPSNDSRGVTQSPFPFGDNEGPRQPAGNICRIKGQAGLFLCFVFRLLDRLHKQRKVTSLAAPPTDVCDGKRLRVPSSLTRTVADWPGQLNTSDKAAVSRVRRREDSGQSICPLYVTNNIQVNLSVNAQMKISLTMQIMFQQLEPSNVWLNILINIMGGTTVTPHMRFLRCIHSDAG